MRNVIYLLFFIVINVSCGKDEPPDVFDFDISDVPQIDARIEETRTIQLLVTCNKISPENVYLTIEDIPAGITCSFDKTEGVPEYAANLEIKIARSVAGGVHKLRLIGSSRSIIKEVPIEITIDKSLSAVFTFYNATTYNPENVSSNLLDSALVKLYRSVAAFDSAVPSYKEYTKEDGKAYFYKLPAATYLFTVEKGDLSNVIQKQNVDGVIKGYIVAGMFRTQQEIINSAQSSAKIGDLKFRDINADNKINSLDLGRYDNLSIYEGELNEKVIWIGK